MYFLGPPYFSEVQVERILEIRKVVSMVDGMGDGEEKGKGTVGESLQLLFMRNAVTNDTVCASHSLRPLVEYAFGEEAIKRSQAARGNLNRGKGKGKRK